MNPTSRAILQTVMTTDGSLTPGERDFVQRLIAGETMAMESTSSCDERLLVTQKRAAELLSVNRVTIWRMTRDCLLHPVEILPGMWRYTEICREIDYTKGCAGCRFAGMARRLPELGAALVAEIEAAGRSRKPTGRGGGCWWCA